MTDDIAESPVTFGELPPTSKRGGRPPSAHHANVASELRGRPGAWALVATRPTVGGAHMLATQIKSGLLVAFRGGVFDAATRGCDVWARYIGPVSE